MSKKVAVIMGSDSDFPTVAPAVKRLKGFGIPVEVRVMSAHRTPDAAAEFSKTARDNGFGVIIAAAGKAAHLAGVLAAHTTLPVIGIPVKSSTLDGLDALLATVQMPSGIPVATVAIDGADNAAILACQMLALSDEGLAAQLAQMKEEMAQGVAKKTPPCRRKWPPCKAGTAHALDSPPFSAGRERGMLMKKTVLAQIRPAGCAPGGQCKEGPGLCHLRPGRTARVRPDGG